MKVLGIIVEYNPFHNGHIYHIKKAKEMTQCDYCIAVMSSSFVQRGEPAIVDKWVRSQLAVQYGVDLVIELPFVYAMQSADYFAKGAIDLLSAMGVSDLCFGSEDGRIDTFIEIAQAIEKNQDLYQQTIKAAMHSGSRYPEACNAALKTILGYEIKTPNDLLGLSYVKEIVAHYPAITPHCFKRTNQYHDTQIQKIASATAIRHAIFHHQDFYQSLPHPEYYENELYCFDDFFPYLQYQLLTSTPQQLKQYHMVDEGLENVLTQVICEVNSMEELIQALLSKRYTRPRIQRMLIHILMKNTKEDMQKAMSVDYIRLLAMNQKGRYYLKQIKKVCPYQLVSRYYAYQHPALDIEFKATKLIALISHHPQATIKKEYQSFPYQKTT